ncbi:ankyrin repeat domain-containing protein [Labedaea rhizosphaerae]|uniref:Ankyrin repeat protein n=1 Tax=Labedaea rhizosphaerae TaxID=598644 RepID=A0A4R6SHA9_LABRH|nr:ankyrin repeat domain-containing protein [Labedaea rhizosphaerae]TDQ01185.1 ankyrin repeat protein [Labedaea rhizosphaerae]
MLGSRLRLAIQQDDLAAVRELLAAGAPVNDTWWQDSFPLQYAARLHGTAVLRALLDAGASVHLADRYGRTALHDAAEHGGPEAVSVLLARGAPVHTAAGADQPLHRAAAKEVVELLLDAGADLEALGDFGATPLLRAAGHPNPAVVHTLLARGADPAATDDAGAGALHEVATAEGAALLLEHLGADAVDRPDVSGYTPLCAAVQRGLADVVDVLLAHGADPDQRLQFGGEPLLHLAAAAGDPAMVRVLLAHGAHPECADRCGNIALHWAADAATGELLLEAGHPNHVHARNASGQTPLHRACDAALIALLLRHGAGPRVEDANGVTPADDAAEVPGALAFLVREGIQVTEAMLDDVVAGAAGERAYRADVRALLDAGARPSATAARIAAQRGDAWLRAALADAGVHTGSLLLDPADQTAVPHQALVVHPYMAEAITVADDPVLVRWSLAEDPPRPIEAFAAGETRWAGHAVPRALAVAPDGSKLVAVGGDRLELRPWRDLGDVTTIRPEAGARLVTVEHAGARIVVSAERGGPLVFDRGGTQVADLGALAERFGADVFAGAWPGGAVLVGDRVVSLSDDAGRLTLTGTDLGGDQPVLRYLHTDDEVGFIRERMSCVGWLGCAPDGRSVAMWAHAQGRPGHGALVVVDPDDGSLRWTRHLSEPGEPTHATACFSGDGQWLAVGLGRRIHWVTVVDGALGAIHTTPGPVHALAWDHTANGLLVAGGAGLHRSPAVDHGPNA